VRDSAEWRGDAGGGARNRKRRARSPPRRANSIRPEGRPPSSGKGSEIAHRSKKFAIAVLRRRSRLHALNLLGSAISSMVGATIGVVGKANASMSPSATSIAFASSVRSAIIRA